MEQVDPEEFCQCSICYEIMVEPLKLECGHYFCSLCLHKQRLKIDFNCAMCREPYDPNLKVDQLRRDQIR